MSNASGSNMPWSEAMYWRLRRRITPGLLNAQYAYFAALEQAVNEGDRWLDLGCGRRLAPSWMRDAGKIEQRLVGRAGEVVGVDPDPTALKDNTLRITKHLGVAEDIPEPDASFDLITANMVVEHLGDPLAVLREASRLLRPGGRLLFHTPNLLYPVTLSAACVPGVLRRRVTAWLEKRPSKDIYPTRYRLNRVGSIQRAARDAGLAVASIVRTADSPETIRLGPLVAGELSMIALTRTHLLSAIRSNLVVTLCKPEQANETSAPTTQQTKRSDQNNPKQLGAAA